MVETETINKLLTNVPLNTITELNELIYAEAKLVSDKIGVPRRISEKMDGKFDLKVKKFRQQTKMLRKEKKKQEYVGMKRPK